MFFSQSRNSSRDTKFHYRAHNNQSLIPIMNLFNPIHTTKSYTFKTSRSIVLGRITGNVYYCPLLLFQTVGNKNVPNGSSHRVLIVSAALYYEGHRLEPQLGKSNPIDKFSALSKLSKLATISSRHAPPTRLSPFITTFFTPHWTPRDPRSWYNLQAFHIYIRVFHYSLFTSSSVLPLVRS